MRRSSFYLVISCGKRAQFSLDEIFVITNAQNVLQKVLICCLAADNVYLLSSLLKNLSNKCQGPPENSTVYLAI